MALQCLVGLPHQPKIMSRISCLWITIWWPIQSDLFCQSIQGQHDRCWYFRDLLIIDRSIEVKNNRIVLAILDTEFTVKRLIQDADKITLRAENDQYPDIVVGPQQSMMVWGVVVHVIHHLK